MNGVRLELRSGVPRSAMRRGLKGLGELQTSTDGSFSARYTAQRVGFYLSGHRVVRSSGDLGILHSMDDRAAPTESGSRWSNTPWWAWVLIVLFPVLLRPWWVAITSFALFAVFLRLILGPFPVRPKSKASMPDDPIGGDSSSRDQITR